MCFPLCISEVIPSTEYFVLQEKSSGGTSPSLGACGAHGHVNFPTFHEVPHASGLGMIFK